jgi:hypothetical protein
MANKEEADRKPRIDETRVKNENGEEMRRF